ncbi:MAG: hypothetical protein J6X19_04600, partial [Clostridia bacterium]|nr:hypothetical protein [Clostridia bacterium]
MTTGDTVRLRLRFAQRGGQVFPETELRVVRRFRTDTAEFTLAPAVICADCLYFELDGRLLASPGVYFYEFSVNDGENICVIPGDRITVTEKGLGVPDWFADTVIYQIFPDR